MSDDGSTKDDVKVPDGEVGDKINKLFTEDGKDTSKHDCTFRRQQVIDLEKQTSSFLLPWVRRLPLMPRKLLVPVKGKQFSTQFGDVEGCIKWIIA